MSNLIERMKNKLSNLETELNAVFDNNPRSGHGGTPNITDNAKGRQMMRVCEKRDERIRTLIAKIKDQKEKIERAEDRAIIKATPTKISEKRLGKQPIHAGLLKLAELGKVKQWTRNPDYFFIVGLDKVALKTFENNEISRTAKFPTKTVDEKLLAFDLIDQAYQLSK